MPSNKNRKDTGGSESIGRIRFPKKEEHEIFGLVTQLMGANQLLVMCQDGVERKCRIPGKLKKRVWVRVNDVVIVMIWDFQPSKGDVVWRFLGNQTEWLRKKGMLEGLPI